MSQKKQYLSLIALVVGALFLSFVVKVYAQAAAGQTPTPNGSSCLMASSTNEYVYLLVPSDGNIKAITGTYNVNLKCTAGDPNCDAIAAAMSTAESDGNSLGSGFPQYTTGSSNNSFEVGFGGDSTTCGNHESNGLPAGACESTAVVSSNGVTSTIAYIYINVSSSDYAVSSKDSAQFASILEHEMTHGFGYGDTYLHINNDPGLMGNGINTTPPTTWKTDSLLLSSIKATNASPAHKITIGNNNACNLICPDGSTATTTSSGSYSCTPPPVTPTSTPSVAPTSTTPTSTPPVTTTPTGTAGGSSGGSVIINGTNHGTVINVNLPGASSSTSPGGWVENFYQFALMIAGVLAFAVVVYGGIRYMTAVGNPSGEEDAKEWIWAALTGLLLLAGAYIILNVVNPQILNLTLPTLKNVSTTSGGGIFGDNNASSTASSTATSTGACPLTALPTLTDPVAISEENGQTVLWTASDPNVQKNLTQLQAEFKKMQAKFPSAQPNSVYRAMQYQALFYAIYQDATQLRNNPSYSSNSACTSLISNLHAEENKHGVCRNDGASPSTCLVAKPNNCTDAHPRGIGIDIGGFPSNTPPSDINNTLSQAGINLQWKALSGDPVHFQLTSPPFTGCAASN